MASISAGMFLVDWLLLLLLAQSRDFSEDRSVNVRTIGFKEDIHKKAISLQRSPVSGRGPAVAGGYLFKRRLALLDGLAGKALSC